MYQSCLLIDVGNDPDRPRPGRLWLRNRYHVHQRLCMAFPSASQKTGDAGFLTPFKPEEFGQGQVHVKRAAGSGFLFRVDPLTNGRAVILVQSARKPDWCYAFYNAGHFLSAPPQVKQLDVSFKQGQHLRFRLEANPTRKIHTKSGADGERRNGKRVPLPTSHEIHDWRANHPDKDPRAFVQGKLMEWLINWKTVRDKKAVPPGFSIVDPKRTSVQPGYAYFSKNGKGQRTRAVLFEGLLQVTDPDAFQQTLAHGIGSGKAFGFGLLSVAPALSADADKAT